ncbi:MAG: hypothetical protein AB7F43_04360 [Bacteriovoracia bacterium]
MLKKIILGLFLLQGLVFASHSHFIGVLLKRPVTTGEIEQKMQACMAPVMAQAQALLYSGADLETRLAGFGISGEKEKRAMVYFENWLSSSDGMYRDVLRLSTGEDGFLRVKTGFVELTTNFVFPAVIRDYVREDSCYDEYQNYSYLKCLNTGLTLEVGIYLDEKGQQTVGGPLFNVSTGRKTKFNLDFSNYAACLISSLEAIE